MRSTWPASDNLATYLSSNALAPALPKFGRSPGGDRLNQRACGGKFRPSGSRTALAFSSCIAALFRIKNSAISVSYDKSMRSAMHFSPFAVMIWRQCTTN
jgi:hypothetical protein